MSGAVLRRSQRSKAIQGWVHSVSQSMPGNEAFWEHCLVGCFQELGALSRSPYNEDHGIVGPILGHHISWNSQSSCCPVSLVVALI